MSDSARRPPRLHRDPEPTPSDLRAVTFRMVSGPDFTVTAPSEQTVTLLDQLRATWRHEAYNSFTFTDRDGSQTLLNPAHVVMVDVR